MPIEKVFYSDSVEAAVALARRQLGEEALLLGACPTEGEDARLGAYRVDFQLPDSPHPLPRTETLGERDELQAIQAELGRLSALVAHLSSGLIGTGCAPELTELGAGLAARDLPPTLVNDLLDRVERRLRLRSRSNPAPAALIRQALIAETESRIVSAPELGPPEAAQKVVALVGPSGCGKTTTLAKLAMREGIGAKRSTLILSTDTHRVAAPDQLRAYAAILGLPFEVAETPAALARLLTEHRQKGLILIDTPGFSPREEECGQEWAAMLAGPGDVETQLVLAATTRTEDLLASMRWWEIFSPAKLIFTRLDETTRPGGCLAAAMLSGKAVSYLSRGPRIPEDLEPASAANLIHLLLGASVTVGAAA